MGINVIYAEPFEDDWDSECDFPETISGEFSEDDILEICNEFGVSDIIEVNVILESLMRRTFMCEASNKKKDVLDRLAKEEINAVDGEDLEDPSPATLDDLTEPEDTEVPPEEIPTEEPSLADLDQPEGEDELALEDPTSNIPVAPIVSVDAPPQPTEIPSEKALSPEEKAEEPKTSFNWKREKHLRTLYNNFFKVFPKKGTSTKLDIKFNSIKADSLHPDSKYLQANVTATCESEKHDGKYYNQWIQLRRQRTTQKWTVDLPCEVRCNCKSFIYYMAYANMKNKSLAGQSTTKGRLDGYPINYNIPSNETNPNHTPALCKHLMSLTNQIFDMNSGGIREQNIV